MGPLLDDCAGLIVMRFLGGSSVLTPNWEKGFAVGVAFGGGAGDSAGFGDEVPDDAASGAVEGGREGLFGVAGPPSFARRFARIWKISSSACLFDGRSEGELTLSASDMASGAAAGAGAGAASGIALSCCSDVALSGWSDMALSWCSGWSGGWSAMMAMYWLQAAASFGDGQLREKCEQ